MSKSVDVGGQGQLIMGEIEDGVMRQRGLGGGGGSAAVSGNEIYDPEFSLHPTSPLPANPPLT